MSMLFGLLFLVMVMVLVMSYPYITQHVLSSEGFQVGRSMLLKTVGKESLHPNTLYLNDYDSGNAKRYLSKLPSVRNGGFSVPDEYIFHPVPDYKQGYELAIKDEPRASEFNRGSHNDPVHLYFQKLYGTLENADE